MPCGWEGNRRSGIALVTRQTLMVLHRRAQGLEEGDEHPRAYAVLLYPAPMAGALSDDARLTSV